jgi:hypothetical protein
VTPPSLTENAEALLALWEYGLAQPESRRADALLQEIAPSALTLGQRNARLLELHARVFGSTLQLSSHCPSCGTALEFGADCDALASRIPAADQPFTHTLEAHGHVVEFRLPGSADIDAVGSEDDPARFAHALLARCVIACSREGVPVPVVEQPQAVSEAVSRQMEALDPGAIVSFAVECPDCAARWDACVDLPRLVWQKVQAAAERLLLDVDVLARAYGWTEHDVLSLRPWRRAAYLQLVNG